MSEEKTEGCFVGPRKVENIVPQDVKTYAGTLVLRVEYAGGYSQLMTQKTFNIVKTGEAKDHNYIRDTKFKELFKELYPLVAKHFMSYAEELTIEEKSTRRSEILKEMISLACEYDLTVKEIEGVLNILNNESNNLFSALGYQIDNAYDRAANFLWSKDDKTFIPGYDQANDLTLIQAKIVLDSIPVPEETKKETPTTDEPNGDTKAE